MSTCHTKPKDSQAMIKAVGQDLVRRRGKQSYYPVSDIQDSVRATGYPNDVSCWALSVYSSPSDFQSHHEALGEACSYFGMRAELLHELAGSSSSSLPDLDISWFEWPDIDWSELFDCLNPFHWFDGV